MASEQCHGRSKRVTIRLPEDLEAAIKAEVGGREFSAYIAEAAARRYQQDQLTKLLDEMDAAEGSVSDEIRRDVATWWPDTDEAP